MNKVNKVNAKKAFTLAIERTCKRSGRNYEQSLSLFSVLFEELQSSFKEFGALEIPNFLNVEMQNRGGCLDKFYTLNENGEKVYRLGEDGKRLKIKRVKFPSIKAHAKFKNFVRGNSPISESSEKFRRLAKVAETATA